MRIAGYNKETISELHGGSASVFRGEYRGRPVAIKVVRLYLNDLEKYLSVRPFYHTGENYSDSATRRGSVKKPLSGNT